MINKRKTILAIIAVSSVSMFTVGCTNENTLVINDIKVKDISKIKDNKDCIISRQTNISNPDKIKEYNKVELISFDSELDEKNKQYKINMTFKNTSDEIIKDLNMRFTLFGPECNITLDGFNSKEVRPFEEFTRTFIVSAENILDSCIRDGEPKNPENFKDVFEIHTNNNGLYLGYNYTCSNFVDNNLNIESEVEFNGNISQIKLISVSTKEEKHITKTHKDNGSYLNLIAPEDTNIFNSIETKNIQFDIDENFDFKITATFKNIGTKEINSFSFQPHLALFNSPISYYSTTDNKDELSLIKPEQEFTVVATIDKGDITFNTDILDKIDSNRKLKHKQEAELLNELIKNRLLSIGYSYHYNINDFTTSVHTLYDNTSKLIEMSLFEYETIIDEELENE